MAAESSEFVRDFETLRRDDTPVAGGKGANLGEMTAAGLPVPPGFVVTGQAYLHALDVAGCRQRLLDIVVNADLDDSSALKLASDELRAAVQAAGVPDDVRAVVMEAFQELGEGARVAVRSSADGGGYGRGVLRRDERDVHQRHRTNTDPADPRLLGVAMGRSRGRLSTQFGVDRRADHRGRDPTDGRLRGVGGDVHGRSDFTGPRPAPHRRCVRARRGRRGRAGRARYLLRVPAPRSFESRVAAHQRAHRLEGAQDHPASRWHRSARRRSQSAPGSARPRRCPGSRGR